MRLRPFTRRVEATVRARDPEVVLTAKPEPAWLDTMTAAQGHTGERAATYRAIVGAIALPTAFVALHHEGQLASLAYGAIHDGFLMCESVITAARLAKARLRPPSADHAAGLGRRAEGP